MVWQAWHEPPWGQQNPGQVQQSLLTEHEAGVSRVRPAESESLLECSLERSGLERVPLSSTAGDRGGRMGWNLGRCLCKRRV